MENTALPRQSVGRFYLLLLQYVVCTLFYYLGEIFTLAGWDSVKWEFLYGVHDFHRLLFLLPLIYAGYVFGMKAVVIMTIIVINTLLPRALFISPFPDPLLRMLLFIVVAGTIGYLTARLHHMKYHLGRAQHRLLGGQAALDALPFGLVVIGPGGKVRFANRVFCDCCGVVGQKDEALMAAIDSLRQTTLEGGGNALSEIKFTDGDGSACRLIIIASSLKTDNALNARDDC